jgi:plasmid stabilization system protein ParE
MNIDYALRARADLSRIGAQSRRLFGEAVAAALETHIRATVARLAVMAAA